MAEDRKPLLFLPFHLILAAIQVIPKKPVGVSKQTQTREMRATKNKISDCEIVDKSMKAKPADVK